MEAHQAIKAICDECGESFYADLVKTSECELLDMGMPEDEVYGGEFHCHPTTLICPHCNTRYEMEENGDYEAVSE